MDGCIRRPRRPMLAGAIMVLAASGALAEPAPPFAQLLRQAANAPRVAALNADVARAEGLSDQARARPNPNVSLYTENIAGSSPYRGFDRAETTLQVNQSIELGGKRSARIAAGQAGVATAQARTLQARIDFADRLARAYAAAERAERRIALAGEEVEEADEDLRAARALVIAGKEARLRSLQAESELQMVEADLEQAKAAHRAALARLSALAGAERPFTGLSESLLDRIGARPAAGPPDPMQSAAVRVADAERVAAASQLVTERRRAIPDVTAQFGVRRLAGDDATAVMAGISLPIGLFDRNRGNIAAAAADLTASEARTHAARLEAQADIAAALAQAEASDARIAAARRALATAEETYRLARIAYQAGKSPLSELLTARHGLGAAGGMALEAASARFDARADLSRLQGLTITGDPVQ